MLVQSHMLGEFLVKNGAITTEQLLDALEFQRESLKVMNLMAIMERSLEQDDIQEIQRRQMELGESLEDAAVELGFLTREELQTRFRDDKSMRIPLGQVLVRQGALGEAEVEDWVKRFESQTFDESARLPLLQGIPLFRNLDEERLRQIAGLLKYKLLEAGDAVFLEDDPTDAIYLIESGLVRMSLKTSDGLHELGTFTSNQWFGLNGILEARPRGQRAEAIMRTALWRLQRDDFLKILRENSEVSMAALAHMSTGLANVFRTIKGDRSVFETNIVSVIVDESSPEAASLARDIIREVYRLHRRPMQALYTLKSLNLPIEPTPEDFGVEPGCKDDNSFFCLQSHGLERSEDTDFLVRWLHQESHNISSLMVVASSHSRDPVLNMLLSSSARTVIVLGEGEHNEAFLGRLKPGRDRVYLIAPPSKAHSAARSIDEALSEDARGFFPQLLPARHLEKSTERDIPEAARRIGRWLNGTTLGVALGGGGARVMAHLGMLEMLEQEGLEVDEICGASGGAVVAGMFASGMKPEEIVKFFEINAIRTRKNPLVDYTIPIKAMAAGRRFEKLLKRGFADRMVYATEIPYFPVTTDMQHGVEFLPRIAPIWQAAKGSAAIPGFHPIVRLNNRLLGDGGILNNVPASVVRRFGSAAVISSNITPDPAHSKLNPDRMMSALIQGIDVMLYQSVEEHLRFTDIEARPPVDGYGTTEFSAGYELLEAGRKEAERLQREVRKLREKLASRGF